MYPKGSAKDDGGGEAIATHLERLTVFGPIATDLDVANALAPNTLGFALE